MVRLLAHKAGGDSSRGEQLLETFMNCREIKQMLSHILEDQRAGHAGMTRKMMIDYQTMERIIEVIEVLKNQTSSNQARPISRSSSPTLSGRFSELGGSRYAPRVLLRASRSQAMKAGSSSSRSRPSSLGTDRDQE